MNRDSLTEEAFRKLLAWLNSNPDAAAETYNKIQVRLIRIFSAHGCAEPEKRTDDTFDRIMAKIDWLMENYVGDPIHYFCAVARNILKEDYRERTRTPFEDICHDPGAADEHLYQCLDECLDKLRPEARSLVVAYYEEQGQKKILRRKRLADSFGITLRALRLRVFHLRAQLKTCLEKCLQNGAMSETI